MNYINMIEKQNAIRAGARAAVLDGLLEAARELVAVEPIEWFGQECLFGVCSICDGDAGAGRPTKHAPDCPWVRIRVALEALDAA